MKTTRLRRVYVWEWPVRFFHWIFALCILVLGITGYLIGDPLPIQSDAEASHRFWFGTARFIHFAAAYIFLAVILMRMYWASVGNKYARWANFVPTRLRFFSRIGQVIRHDILLMKVPEDTVVGHNALAGLSYFFLMLLTFVMVFTGFGMYAQMSTWWLPKLFSWMPGLFGGDYLVREIHHAGMWLFAVFIVIHLYLVFYHDQQEGRGEASSMISGYKFMEEEVFENKKAVGEPAEPAA
ncbi:MAG: Ni/Fe-hydrogenase, b-type cytochrome subunit [Lewinellaceae bacterium]|nr:Ni/Fe-hydrogenase, b-type cytochrome subunit [Lewinella sp.]MCB9279932.1 Ni/Fe-hydrogenase, b-type cytochrome subunit [Lewinellaceae bacterium]